VKLSEAILGLELIEDEVWFGRGLQMINLHN
jgi:hypothetical protein